MTRACLYHGPSYLPVYWSCPLALPLGLPCLRGLPLWVWLGLFGSLPPWFPFCGVGWFFAGLFAPLVWSGCLGIPTPWSRLFPLGLCSRSSWRAFVVGCCCCCRGRPLALRCLFGGSSDQSSHSSPIFPTYSPGSDGCGGHAPEAVVLAMGQLTLDSFTTWR